jgi:hypothetical protein
LRVLVYIIISFLIINSVYAQIKIPPKKDKTFYIVQEPSAVFYEPDSIEFAKMEKEIDTISLADIVEDNQAYTIDAYKLLEKAKFKTVYTEADFIYFPKSDSTYFTVDKSKLENRWGLFLFDGVHDPNLSTLTDMIPAVKEFLKRIKK